MTQVCRFTRLPVAVQREIEQRLIENGFSDYVPIAAELKRRGYRISKSSLGRIGKQLKARLKARFESLRDQHLARVGGLSTKERKQS